MLDVTAFSNALLEGDVSYLASIDARVLVDRSGEIRVHVGDDAVVYPLGRGATPVYALRVPLNPTAAQSWPARYADVQSIVGGLRRFLPPDLTILDSDAPGEPDMALLYRWIPGETIADVIRDHAPPARLDAIVDAIADLAEALRASGMVHGDIAPGNLIVRPDNSIGLIDLDRFGDRNDRGISPRRRPGYRLPNAGAGPEAEDAFGLLVTMTSVAAISQIGDRLDDDDLDRGSHPALMFSSWDLMDPGRSQLVRELNAELSGVPALLLDYLVGACKATSAEVPRILAEAVHEIRRTPRWTRIQAWTPSEPEEERSGVTEDPVQETERPPHPARDSWGVDVREEPPSETPPKRPESNPVSVPDTRELLEEIASLAATRADGEDTRSRHRARVGRRQEAVAKELREALDENRRDVLVRLAMSGDIAELGDSDRSDLLKVVRALSYDYIAHVISRDQDSAIVAAIDPQIFPSDNDIDEEFRDRVVLARERDNWHTQLISAVQSRDDRRCVELLTEAPPEALERLPEGVQRRVQRLADVSTLVADIKRAVSQGSVAAIIGPMARLSATTGNWSALIDADELVSTVGYPRIRQRVIDRLKSGELTHEDQWLVDCVVGAGELEDVARSAGRSRDEIEALLARKGRRHPEIAR